MDEEVVHFCPSLGVAKFVRLSVGEFEDLLASGQHHHAKAVGPAVVLDDHRRFPLNAKGTVFFSKSVEKVVDFASQFDAARLFGQAFVFGDEPVRHQMPRVNVDEFSHLEDVRPQGFVVLRLPPSVPAHVGRRGDVGALNAGDVAIGQVVVEQDEVGFGPVHGQFIIVVQGDVGQHQRPGDAVNRFQPVEVGRTHGAGETCGFDHGLDGGDVLDVTLVPGVALGVDVDPRAVGVGAVDVILEQGREFGEVLLGDVVESCREVVGIHHANLPTCIPDVNAAVDRDGHLAPLLLHPGGDFVPH